MVFFIQNSTQLIGCQITEPVRFSIKITRILHGDAKGQFRIVAVCLLIIIISD